MRTCSVKLFLHYDGVIFARTDAKSQAGELQYRALRILYSHKESENHMNDFYSVPVQSIDGSPDLLGRVRGWVSLAVNVASRCGYTPQYAGLEQLHRDLRVERFTVVGFPCNQFGSQEPAGEEEIMRFCQSTYDVTFPLSAKLEVNGPQRHPLYTFLTAAENGFPGDIGWNFEKFLIGRDGRVLKRYASDTKPEDKGLMQDIADALD
jgi:glutathione peroxidase